MSRKVSFARLHQGLHVPGIGDLGSVFPAPNKTLQELSMDISDIGLNIKFKYSNVGYDLLIPATNVIGMRLLPQEENSKVK